MSPGSALAAAGVHVSDAGAVIVDDRFRTSAPHILAVGDVIDRVQLTPVALAEAMTVVEQLFGSRNGRCSITKTSRRRCSPIRTSARSGLTEAQARERYGRVRIYRSEFRPLKHTLSGASERTLMKLMVDEASDRVVGVHMVGEEAGEIVQGFAVALKAGATKAVFDATIGIHPTAAEEFVTMREAGRRLRLASHDGRRQRHGL